MSRRIIAHVQKASESSQDVLVYLMYLSVGVWTLRTWHFGTGAEVSIGHFSTTVKIRDTSAPVIFRTQKCLMNDRQFCSEIGLCIFYKISVTKLIVSTSCSFWQCVYATLIYVFKKNYFIADLRHIFWNFLYTVTKFLCTRQPPFIILLMCTKKVNITNGISISIVVWRKHSLPTIHYCSHVRDWLRYSFGQ